MLSSDQGEESALRCTRRRGHPLPPRETLFPTSQCLMSTDTSPVEQSRVKAPRGQQRSAAGLINTGPRHQAARGDQRERRKRCCVEECYCARNAAEQPKPPAAQSRRCPLKSRHGREARVTECYTANILTRFIMRSTMSQYSTRARQTAKVSTNPTVCLLYTK